MVDLKYLIANKDVCDKLLVELHCIATDLSAYDYGLPIYDEASKAWMREAIYNWVTSLPTSKE